MLKKKKYYYCDMDGVLADFHAIHNAMERFKTEKGFFTLLPPIYKNLDAIRYLINSGKSVRVITASPNEQADKDKRKWLEIHLPELQKNRIITIRLGENKADYMKTKVGVLFDDWGKNGRDWAEREGNEFFKVSPDNSIWQYIRGL